MFIKNKKLLLLLTVTNTGLVFLGHLNSQENTEMQIFERNSKILKYLLNINLKVLSMFVDKISPAIITRDLPNFIKD